MYFTSKKRKQLEQKITSLRERLSYVKEKRDCYRDQRNELRMEILRLNAELKNFPSLKNGSKHEFRLYLAQSLSGSGIEIGALSGPQPVPHGAEVQYVDFRTREENIERWEYLPSENIVETHYVGNGEKLEMLKNESQDFVIANHMLEHCINPIAAVENFLRVTRPGGRLLLTIPDKRFTFDWKRPVTPFSHILEDYRNNTEVEPLETYLEWKRLVDPDANAEKMFEIQENIHFHAWTQHAIMEMFYQMQSELNFPIVIENMLAHHNEVGVVLRKGRIEDDCNYIKSDEDLDNNGARKYSPD